MAPTATASNEKELTVVGIGASAGGLEALSSLVRNLPKHTGMTFIIAQHREINEGS